MGTDKKPFSWAIMAKKGVVYAVNLAAGYLAVYGVDLGPKEKAALVLLASSGLAMLRNTLKNRYPDTFGWL